MTVGAAESYILKFIVDRFHVRTSNREILRAVRQRLRRGGLTRAERKAFYRRALRLHRHNKLTYQRYRF